MNDIELEIKEKVLCLLVFWLAQLQIGQSSVPLDLVLLHWPIRTIQPRPPISPNSPTVCLDHHRRQKRINTSDWLVQSSNAWDVLMEIWQISLNMSRNWAIFGTGSRKNGCVIHWNAIIYGISHRLSNWLLDTIGSNWRNVRTNNSEFSHAFSLWSSHTHIHTFTCQLKVKICLLFSASITLTFFTTLTGMGYHSRESVQSACNVSYSCNSCWHDRLASGSQVHCSSG